MNPERGHGREHRTNTSVEQTHSHLIHWFTTWQRSAQVCRGQRER